MRHDVSFLAEIVVVGKPAKRRFQAGKTRQDVICLEMAGRPSGTLVVVARDGPDIRLAELVDAPVAVAWRTSSSASQFGVTTSGGGRRLLLSAAAGDGWIDRDRILIYTPKAAPKPGPRREP